MTHEEMMRKFMVKVSWLRGEAANQFLIGNRDTSEYFSKVAHEAEGLIFEIAAFLIEKPESSVEDVRAFLNEQAKSDSSLDIQTVSANTLSHGIQSGHG